MGRRRAHVAIVAAGLALGGCRSAPAESVTVATWSAELPGRAEPLEVTLPAHFDDELPRAPSEYVLRARVDVPPSMRGRPLTLAVAHMPAIATLKVDGSEAVAVDDSVLDRYRSAGPHRWRIPEDASKDGELALEIRVSHRMIRSAWIDSAPVLTTDPLGGLAVGGVRLFNVAAATGALATGVVVALIYGFLFASLRDRRRRAYGWFALGATTGMAYPAFVLDLTQPVFGVYEPAFMTVALVLTSIAAMSFSRAYADAPPPSRMWWVVLGLVTIAALLASDPFLSTLAIGPIVFAVSAAITIAQLLFVVRLRRERRDVPPTVYGVAFAWPATVLLGLPDILAWVGQGEPSGGVRTACLAAMAMSLYQAVAVSREHLGSLKRADELVAELAERVKLLQAKHREVELLNDELRRQIAARSRELAEKLAKMDDDELAPPPALEPGDVVEGRYRVVKPLGTGGMGAVYEVERVADGKHFALKALSGGGDAQARARFAREAQICANVNHPNVVSIVDVDVAKSGFIFLVMELVVDGTTLHDVRRRHRDVPWTLGVLAQVAEGIDAIHAAGIIHRDLKPGNILLSRGSDGRRPLVKITDFGISSLQPDGTHAPMSVRPVMDSLPPASEAPRSFAPPEGLPAVRVSDLEAERAKAEPESTMLIDLEYDPEVASETAKVEPPEPETVQDGAAARPRAPSERARTPEAKRTPSSPLTETGLIFGTPQYMAQELTAGTKNATRASDVFSLGILAFELLTGKRPFSEAPVSAKLGGRPLPEAPAFRKMCPTLPAGIAALLDRAMSHDPRDRPTAAELAIELRATADKLAP